MMISKAGALADWREIQFAYLVMLGCCFLWLKLMVVSLGWCSVASAAEVSVGSFQ